MLIAGYSGGGPVAFEMAMQAQAISLECKLYLIDPSPYCHRSTNDAESYLMLRAKNYDLFFGFLLRTQTSFEQAVSLNDISSVGQLEQNVFSAAPSEQLACELSSIVDTAVKQSMEVAMTWNISPHRKFAGPCAFLKADPDYFIKSLGYDADDVHHSDAMYGWSLPLSCPVGVEPTSLACGHLNIFKDREALSQVTSTIISLLNTTETIGEP